ncbi:MAG: type II toxin-antitoxin system RelE/ParE family toxin [Alphaproteobacteria bacterium]|nr:type II toxin-antitoxin system RelE/ParE family toxin [Alphaproteobacteria bacterium]
MPYHWGVEIVRTRIYERKAAKLLSGAETLVAENEIAAAPEKWPVVSGTGGIRKARAARGNAGKSGGVRIMYYFWLNEEAVYLLDIYAKNEKENLSDAEKKVLKGIIKELKGGDHA